MRKVLSLLVVAVLLAGCAGSNWNVPAGNQAILTSIELGGYGVGLLVGKSKTEADDNAIAAAFKLAREGTLDVAVVNNALADLKLADEELAGASMILLKRMGATVTTGADGVETLASLSKIPLEYWDAAAEGYALGWRIGSSSKKGLKKQSAVTQYLPKK